MTEDEDRWLNGTDPLALLHARHPMHTLGSVEPQRRQSRMYLLACARRAWARLPAVCRALVELAEWCADARDGGPLFQEAALIAARLLTADGEPGELGEAAAELNRHLEAHGRTVPAPSAAPIPKLDPEEWRGLSALVYLPFDTHTPNFRWVPPVLHDAHLIREVYGNPYRRVPFDAQWRTGTAVELARGMYDRREFSAMPILADALQDAGCTEAAVLTHCRDTSRVHARGCWVLDLVLNLR
jgi:hypothetical protein